MVGPTFDLEELAGRKTLALFDRAEARDFTDVYALAKRYGKELLLTRAAEVDLGFNRAVFAQMLGTLSRFDDSELPIPDVQKTDQTFGRSSRPGQSNWMDDVLAYRGRCPAW